MNYIIIASVLFCIGVLGLLIRRNLIVILMSIELILSAAHILFVYFSNLHSNLDGQVIVLISFVVAACEVAVGLAIIVMLYRLKGTININDWSDLKK